MSWSRLVSSHLYTESRAPESATSRLVIATRINHIRDHSLRRRQEELVLYRSSSLAWMTSHIYGCRLIGAGPITKKNKYLWIATCGERLQSITISLTFAISDEDLKKRREKEDDEEEERAISSSIDGDTDLGWTVVFFFTTLGSCLPDLVQFFTFKYISQICGMWSEKKEARAH